MKGSPTVIDEKPEADRRHIELTRARYLIESEVRFRFTPAPAPKRLKGHSSARPGVA